MKKKICVMGSFIVDLMGRAPHLPVTGETVKGTVFKIGPGGKGSNQGVAAKRAGGDVTMVTKIGKDAFGKIALDSFMNEGMDTRYVFQDDAEPSGAALIMVDENSGDNKIVVITGACDFITDDIIHEIEGEIKSSGVFLTQLETNLDAVEKAVDIAHANGVTVILNPAPGRVVSDELLRKVDILTPNETEATALSGVDVKTVEDASKAAKALMSKGVGCVIVTMGSRGSLVVTSSGEEFIESIKVEAVDTTGAGDAYNGGLATAIAVGKDIREAARFATATGALSVTRMGTAPSMPYRDEIEKMMKEVYGR